MNRIAVLSVCIAVVSLAQALVPSSALAQTQSSWSIAGAGCVPTGQTAAGVGTFNSAGDVGFPAGKVGEIIVTCPVPPTVVRANGLRITFRDTDGPGSAVQLRAALRQKRLVDGAVSDFGGAVFNSSILGPSPANQQGGAVIGNGCNGLSFDHSRFAYYVQVNLVRRQAAQTVLLATVDIGNTTLC